MAQLKQQRQLSREGEGDERLIRYLLHELTPEEENAVEEQYFSDAALHERLLVVEDEVIDSYVGGDLSPDRCELFEEWFLASPERREKVEIARSLASHAESTANAARQTNRRSVHIFRNAMLAGTAAATVLLAGAFLVLRHLGASKMPQITAAKDVRPPAAAGPVVAGRAHTANWIDDGRSKIEALAREALAKNQAKAPTTDLAKATPSGAKLDQVEVEPLPGQRQPALIITTDPPGASVRINGGPACTSNCRLSLPPGNWQLTASLDGYESAVVSVKLRDGSDLAVHVSLWSQDQTLRGPDAAKDARPRGPKPEVAEVPRVNTPGGPSSNLPPQTSPSTEVREPPRPLPPPPLQALPPNAGLGFLQLILRGKVVMQDGSPPPKSVGIERVCTDVQGSAPGPITDKKGEYLWRMEVDSMLTRMCRIRATLAGYVSTEIDISAFNSYTNPNLPPLVLTARGADTDDPTKLRFIPLSVSTPALSLPLPPGIGGVYFGACSAEPCLMFAFDVALPLLMEGKFRWTVNYEDANNFVLFEVDKQTFSARRVTGGKVFVVARVQFHHERDKFRMYMEVTPARINHAFSESGETQNLYSMDQPGHNLSQGRIGILVDKN